MASDLHNLISNILQSMTHAQLGEAPRQIAGFVIPVGTGLSKRQRIDLALENLTQVQLAHLALKFAAPKTTSPSTRRAVRYWKPVTRP